MSETQLIDHIYEASLVPELWPDVLDKLAMRTEGKGGLLLSSRDRVLAWTSSDDLEEAFSAYIHEGHFKRCARRVCVFKHAHSAFLTEKDYWSPDEIENNEVYNTFFRPRGLGWSAGTGLQVPTGDDIAVMIERSLERGPMEKTYVDELNDLRPHIARSALMASRLGLKSAKTSGETLSKLGLPIMVFDADGKVVEARNMDDSLSDYVIWSAGNRLTLKDSQANALFRNSLKMLSENREHAVKSFPVRSVDSMDMMVGHIIPVSRSAHDIFANSYALLALTPVNAKTAPSTDLIRSLFDLTASEARVARALASGQSPNDIADNADVSINTVRTQLRKIMEKTGCSRQSEVVALMANITLER